MSVSRRAILLVSALAPLALVSGVMQESKARNAVNTLAGNGLAIHGHDPVAYFVDGEPRKGRPDLTLEYKGAVWRFANEANRRLFESDPGRYAPVFGGYCAYGVSRGYLVKIDPAAWSIVHGRLYLNYDLDVRATWLAEADEYIRRATATWPQLVDEN